MPLDLNASRQARAAAREARGQAVTVILGDTTYNLPVELPGTIIDRFLNPEVEIAQLLVVAFRSFQEGQTRAGDLILDVLGENPTLPHGVLQAIYATLSDLFGADAWAHFRAQNPSLQDMWELVRGLVAEYGLSLGESSRSESSSPPGGPTSSPTSPPTTTAPTPGSFSPPPPPPASSDSAA